MWSKRDWLLFQERKWQSIYQLDYVEADTIGASCSGDPQGLIRFSLQSSGQSRLTSEFYLRPRWFPKFKSVVCSRVDSAREIGIFTVKSKENKRVKATRLIWWPAESLMGIHTRAPFIERMSDSTCMFNDPDGKLYVVNVRLDSVVDTGLRGFRPLAFKRVTNQVVCCDLSYEKLYIVSLNAMTCERLPIERFLTPVLYVESVDAVLFHRYQPFTLTEATDLILHRFGDNTEEIIAKNVGFTSGVLVGDSVASQYLPNHHEVRN